MLRLGLPQSFGHVVNGQRCARTLHRLDRRLCFLALDHFKLFRFALRCAARRAVKPMTFDPDVELVDFTRFLGSENRHETSSARLRVAISRTISPWVNRYLRFFEPSPYIYI